MSHTCFQSESTPYSCLNAKELLARIRNGSILDVNQHSKTEVHVKNEKQMRSQCTYKTSTSSLTGCSKPNFEGRNLAGFNMVDKYHSSSSANGDSERFKKMFLDLQIAAKYSQEETKSKRFSIWSHSILL